MHNLKVECYVFFGGLTEDFKPGRQRLKLTLRKLLQGGEGGARIYRSFATKGR